MKYSTVVLSVLLAAVVGAQDNTDCFTIGVRKICSGDDPASTNGNNNPDYMPEGSSGSTEITGGDGGDGGSDGQGGDGGDGGSDGQGGQGGQGADGSTSVSGGDGECPDSTNTVNGQQYCCPGPVRVEADSTYCCVGAPVVDARPCFPFCTDSTTYSCSTTIPVTASDYDSLVLTAYLHSTYGAMFTGPAGGSDSAATPTADSGSDSGSEPADTGAPSSAQGASAPSSTAGAAMITQAPIALGAAALMALAAL